MIAYEEIYKYLKNEFWNYAIRQFFSFSYFFVIFLLVLETNYWSSHIIFYLKKTIIFKFYRNFIQLHDEIIVLCYYNWTLGDFKK